MRLTSLLLPVATVCVLLVAPASAQNHYGWSLSESTSDPCASTGAPTFDVKQLYLWHTYNTGTPVTAMEFAGFTGSITQLTSLIPAGGWMLPDFPPPYALFNFSCPAAPSLVGTLLVLDTGGTLCPGEITAVDCDNNVWPAADRPFGIAPGVDRSRHSDPVRWGAERVGRGP